MKNNYKTKHFPEEDRETSGICQRSLQKREPVIANLKELYDWMIEASGEEGFDPDSSYEDIDDNVYEVHVNIHMRNGDVVHLQNKCVESFMRGSYHGDDMDFYDDDKAYLHITINGVLYMNHVEADQISWVESYIEEKNLRAIISDFLYHLKKKGFTMSKR